MIINLDAFSPSNDLDDDDEGGMDGSRRSRRRARRKARRARNRPRRIQRRRRFAGALVPAVGVKSFRKKQRATRASYYKEERIARAQRRAEALEAAEEQSMAGGISNASLGASFAVSVLAAAIGGYITYQATLKANQDGRK